MGTETDRTLQLTETTAELLCADKLIHCTPHGFCEWSHSLLIRQENMEEMNWGCRVPSAAMESGQARHAAKQGLQ